MKNLPSILRFIQCFLEGFLIGFLIGMGTIWLSKIFMKDLPRN